MWFTSPPGVHQQFADSLQVIGLFYSLFIIVAVVSSIALHFQVKLSTFQIIPSGYVINFTLEPAIKGMNDELLLEL